MSKHPKPNGRRALRAELEARYRWLEWDPESPMLRVAMAPRRRRRQLQGKNFRPVYGYLGYRPVPEFVPGG